MSVLVTRTSPFSRRPNAMQIPLTEEEFTAAMDAWQSGTLIQNAFPTLTADQREFIKTGITPEEWDSIFGKE